MENSSSKQITPKLQQEENQQIYGWVKYALQMLVGVAIFCYAIWLFEEEGTVYFSKYILSPYLNIPIWLARVLTLTATVILVIKAILVCKYKQAVRWRYVLPLAIGLLIVYIRYRWCVHQFEFITEPITGNRVSYIGYLLVMNYILLLITFIVECKELCKRTQKQADTVVAYSDDEPEELSGEDALKYKVRAENIAKEIQTLPLNHAWSIGIVGQWGSGKSTFINFITGNLPKDKYCLITYNPRMAPSVRQIQEQALAAMEEQLRIYNTDLFDLLYRYMVATKIADTNNWLQLLFNLFRKPEGSEALKSRLDNVLRQLPVRIIFVIEDFDRLTKEEIIEVLKLIDGNAKFSNIIYIAAYDYTYIKELFGDSHNGQHYLSKYFYTEHHVPFRPSNYIQDFIINDLSQNPLKISDAGFSQTPDTIIKDRWNMMKEHLRTLRDAKRFLNILRSDYRQVEKEVDLEDFLLITLIKYSDITVYEELFFYPQKYLDTQGIISYIINSNKKFDAILTALFPQTSEPSRRPRRIREKDSFLTYFVAEIYSLKMSDMTKVFSMSKDEAKVQINKWIADNEIGDFINFMCFNYKWFISDDAELIRYADICFMLLHETNHNATIPDMRELFMKNILELSNHGEINAGQKDKYRRYLVEYLTKTQWNTNDMRMITRLVSALFDPGANKYLVSAKEVTDICEQQLAIKAQQYMEKPSEEIFSLSMTILQSCVEADDNNGIKLRAEACRIMRNMIDREPVYYLRDFVTIDDRQDGATKCPVFCEVFWKQIFATELEFEHFIENANYDKLRNIERDRNFWKLYKANDYESFRIDFSGKNMDSATYDFAAEIDMLNTLKSYSEQMDEIMKFKAGPVRRKYNHLEELQTKVEEVQLDNIFKSKLLGKIRANKKKSLPKAEIYSI